MDLLIWIVETVFGGGEASQAEDEGNKSAAIDPDG